MVLVVVAACWRGSTTTATTANSTENATDDQQVLVATGLPSAPVAPPEKPSGYMIAGCNTGCDGCSLGKSTNVRGIDMKTGKELFPHPNSAAAGGGYSCSAYLPIGAPVRLIASSGDGLVLAKWKPFNADDYCPCAGTNHAVCDVKVTQEIAAKFTRVYCGAEWKPQGAAQIGH